MKYLISFIIGLIAFFLCFSGGGDIINLIVSGVTNGPIHFVLKLILWVLFFGVIFKISYVVGVLVSTFVASILERFD